MNAAVDNPVMGGPEALEKSMLLLNVEDTRVEMVCNDLYVPDDTPERPADPLLRPMPNANRLELTESVVPMK